MNWVKFFIVFLLANTLLGQTIKGEFSLLTNHPITLESFNGLKSYPISGATTDRNGKFHLSYTQEDYGVGYLISSDQKPFLVILSGEDIELVGETLSYTETIKVVSGKENLWFEQYASEHPKREQALNAWKYLNKIYNSDSLFGKHQEPIAAILTETNRIMAEDKLFLGNLPLDSYVSWFLPMRKLISGVSTIAQYRPEEIPATIKAFREIDYTDNRLYKSGLFKDAIESHFWLLENSGRSLDSVFIEMKVSIDAMMENLIKEEKILNEVTDFLFDLLERHSLFKASEYLALKVLNEVSCTIDNDLAKQLETYRAMKKGNTAPDILFEEDNVTPGYGANSFPKKLSDIKSNYTVVVFGASWCPKCTEELPKIVKLYQKWKAQGVDVVFVSLDEDKSAYKDFVKNFPFISTCDYKKWDSKIVKDYYVFGTPTMYLLDNKREILLRPNSVNQMDSWVDWNLIDGNR